MTIAYTVEKFLQARGMPFDMLKDDEDHMVAVLPATHRAILGKLLSQTGRSRCRNSDQDQEIAAFLP